MTKRKKPEDKLPAGRPKTAIYTKELGEKLCRIVSTTTDGLRKICKDYPEFHGHTTVYEWKIANPEFSDMYERAKRHQAEIFAEEIMQIADDSSQDEIVDEKGIRCNTEFVQRARLRVDTRKWMASKLIPRVYGDKVQNETTVTVIKHEDALRALE